MSKLTAMIIAISIPVGLVAAESSQASASSATTKNRQHAPAFCVLGRTADGGCRGGDVWNKTFGNPLSRTNAILCVINGARVRLTGFTKCADFFGSGPVYFA